MIKELAAISWGVWLDDDVMMGFAKKLWSSDVFSCVPARYVVSIAASVGFIIVFGLRVNLSMAMVVMADSTTGSTTEASSSHTNLVGLRGIIDTQSYN